jgi:predicted RNA-binding Zn ribbon-like protein
MTALFLGSHPAMDFLNTAFLRHGEPVDVISDGAAFVEWLTGARLLEPAQAAAVRAALKAQVLDDAAAKARKLRAWATTWIARLRDEPGADTSAERRKLNGLLCRASGYRELVEDEDEGEPRVVERWRLDTADQLVALVAAELARFVTDEPAALVKRCAGEACTLWFLDRTKGHRRVFCSASACGNRAKVARFRQRQQRP